MEVWSAEHQFPIDIDYMISDTLELLRPKMRLCISLEDSARQVTELEREFLVKLGNRPREIDTQERMHKGTHTCTHTTTRLLKILVIRQSPRCVCVPASLRNVFVFL